jgi:hypothetical protein
VVFPGPGIYRGMQEENGLPRLGDSPNCLGVRVPPALRPDIVPDSAGYVHPPSSASYRGMSCAVRIQDLPAHRRPVHWNGTRSQADFKVWVIDEDDLGSDLIAFRDSPTHITIAPARTMTLAVYRTALAVTQSRWVQVIP